MAADDPVRRRLDMDSADLLDDVAVRARIVSTRNVAAKSSSARRSRSTTCPVQHNDLAHVVRRRYSEFRQLHDALAREFGPSYANLIAGLLPPKLVIGNADAELIAERMTALDAYLSAVLAVPALSRSARVGAFLALPAVSPRASVAGGWLLTGSWTPDEAHTRDTLEPLLQAMGTPWAIRRMLAGVKIVTTYEHAAGGSLSERAVSTVGEGAPNTILLDGVAHPTKIGGRDGTVRAVERPEAGVVRIETTLPVRRWSRRRRARACSAAAASSSGRSSSRWRASRRSTSTGCWCALRRAWRRSAGPAPNRRRRPARSRRARRRRRRPRVAAGAASAASRREINNQCQNR